MLFEKKAFREGDRNFVKAIQSQLKDKLIESREVNNKINKKSGDQALSKQHAGCLTRDQKPLRLQGKERSDSWTLGQSQMCYFFSPHDRFIGFSAFFFTVPNQNSHSDCSHSFPVTPLQSHLAPPRNL